MGSRNPIVTRNIFRASAITYVATIAYRGYVLMCSVRVWNGSDGSSGGEEGQEICNLRVT